MKRYIRLLIILPFIAAQPYAHSQSGILKDDSAPLDTQFNIIPDTAKKLEGQALKDAFSDVTHHGQYRFLRQAADTFAFSETTYADGTLKHIQGAETLRGIWAVNADQICYTYARIWTYPVCFNIYKSGTCYYHLLRSTNGVTQFAVTARSTPSTQTPDCDALTS